MSALNALTQALDVQRSTAQGVVGSVRPLPAPALPSRSVDKVTLSTAARAQAATRAPGEGEPTDLEGAHRHRPEVGLAAPPRTGHPAVSADPGPVHVDLFA